MAEIGKINNLKVVRKQDFGIYLDGENLGEILLPNKYIPENTGLDDKLDVFIFFDSEDRIIATTEIPFVMTNQFAYLKVVSTTQIGAFLDWGLQKDLLVPFREQKRTMEMGKSYVVYVYLDKKSNRIAATTKIDKYLDIAEHNYKENDQVDLLICYKTDLGYKAIVNNAHWGVLYGSELFQPLSVGQRIKGYIKKVRDDKKLDLSLSKSGIEKLADFAQLIIDKLEKNNGFLPVTDSSPTEDIYKLFGISKKAYKKAVGALYKRRLIIIEDKGIRIAQNISNKP